MKRISAALLSATAVACLTAAAPPAPVSPAADAPRPLVARVDPAPTALPPGVKTTFVHHAPSVIGLLYEPIKPGPKAAIGVVVTHGGDYLRFPACTELSKRGYRVLCEYPSSDDLDKTIAETKLAVDFLKGTPGVRKVVLFGHSGGATIVTAYQAIAENGVGFCQDAQKVHACPNALSGLTAADGVVLPDANWGNAEMALFSVDPAILDENSGAALDPALDMYALQNGYKPGGTQYDQGFRRKFLAAEAARYTRLVKAAQYRLSVIESGSGPYTDDEPLVIPGGSSLGPNNKLYSQDVTLLSRSAKPYPLIHKDGSVTVEPIHSVRVTERAAPRPSNLGITAMRTTVRQFLSGSAIRVDPDFYYDESSIHGIQWGSSYASPPGNAEHIAAPLLAMGMTGHWEGLAAETIYEHAVSTDRQIAFVEGATHMYDTCKLCEASPGQFGDTTRTTFDYIDRWLSKPGRFLK